MARHRRAENLVSDLMLDDPTLWFGPVIGPAVGAFFGWLDDMALCLRSIGL